ncbi:MAG: single-stranded-DNA-specific exonuclease RecJ [Halanaerobiales bacterium]
MEVVFDKIQELPKWLIEITEGNKLLAGLMWKRGIRKKAEARQYLNPEHYEPTAPFAIPGMKKAVNILKNVIENNGKICVYGDYDVDGVTATAILLSVLKELNAKTIYHIPDRFKEGYGLDKDVIIELAEQDIDLILTCDCGISNSEEIKMAQNMGMEVIVTDHHDLPAELPSAEAVVTARLLSEEHSAHYLPGAGIAYLLAAALLRTEGRRDSSDNLLDLLSLALVADVVPLRGENRYLLKMGMARLKNTERPGILSLFAWTGVDNSLLTEEDIAFRLAPVLNAAGRIEHADLALKLLISKNKKEADKMAARLVQVNEKRRNLQQKIIKEALEIQNNKDENEAVVLYKPDWHEGILGIAAGRLAEEFQIPALLMGLKEDGKTITGSARSIEQIHIREILDQCSELLEKYGGHAGAAGFSLKRDNLNPFRKKVKVLIESRLKEIAGERKINVDDKLELSSIDLDVYYELRQLAPFGEGNPKPIFISKENKVVHSRDFSDNKHQRLLLQKDGTTHEAVWWWGGNNEIKPYIDLIFSIDINRFQGREKIQLLVKEIASTKSKSANIKKKTNSFELIDYRDSRPLKDFDNTTEGVYYYEGRKNIKFSPLINRFQLQNIQNLILLSIPPSPEIFREIIKGTEAKKVFLVFPEKFLNDDGDFLNILSGIIKYNINNNAKITIYQLAVATGQREDTVELGIKYLASKGFIAFTNPKPGVYIIYRGDGREEGISKVYRRKLRDLLKEKKAFNRFVLNKSKEEIEEMLKRGG